jgi:hypothetical protein
MKIKLKRYVGLEFILFIFIYINNYNMYYNNLLLDFIKLNVKYNNTHFLN